MFNGKINRIKRFITKKNGTLYVGKDYNTLDKIILNEEERNRNILLFGSENEAISFYKKIILQFIKNNEPFVFFNDIFYSNSFHKKIIFYAKKYNYSYKLDIDNYNVEYLNSINFFDRDKSYFFNLKEVKNENLLVTKNKNFNTYFKEYLNSKIHSDFEFVYTKLISNEILNKKIFNIVFGNLPLSYKKTTLFFNSSILNVSLVTYYKDYISYNASFDKNILNIFQSKIYFFDISNQKFDDLNLIIKYKNIFSKVKTEKGYNYLISEKNSFHNKLNLKNINILKMT